MGLVVFVIVDGYDEPIKFVSLTGFFVFSVISVMFSENVDKVSLKSWLSAFK